MYFKFLTQITKPKTVICFLMKLIKYYNLFKKNHNLVLKIKTVFFLLHRYYKTNNKLKLKNILQVF